jgi:murein DD-endopeptidase MepM/ murein hydrolase activator NlpD
MRSTTSRALRGPASILSAAAALALAAVLVVACGGARAVAPDGSLPGQAGSPSPTALNSTAVAPGSCGAASLNGSAGESATSAGASCAVPGTSGPPGADGAHAAAGSTARPDESPLPASETPAPLPAAPPSPAPTSPVHFPYRRAVVPLGFPLAASATYTYRRDFLVPRVGKVYPYNHALSTAPNGTLRRAHDGVDIAVAIGTPVRAPFSGTVIDPATRWKPWDPARFGKVVVIVSDEPTSPGYSVILAHLSKVNVKVGQHVSRGQIVGRTGITGNAAGTPPHLHFELRAPFLIRVKEAGTIRKIDAFDPYPSLTASDPHRQ